MIFTKDTSSVTFKATLFPLVFQTERTQHVNVAESGQMRVYDRGTQAKFIKLQIRDNYTNLLAIRDFINVTCNMMANTFLLSPDTGIDMGNGDGGAMTVRYWDSNFVEIQNFYHQYFYELLLRIEDELLAGGTPYADDFEDVGYIGGPI